MNEMYMPTKYTEQHRHANGRVVCEFCGAAAKWGWIHGGGLVQLVTCDSCSPCGSRWFRGIEFHNSDASATTRRRSLNLRKRFAILKRDGFKCRLCGRAAPDVKLHVDHKTPKARGGSDDDTNLWTLCEDCNLGKATTEL